MDYTVGSIAALISGNEVTDKIKVKKISVKLNEKKQGKGKKLPDLDSQQEYDEEINVKKVIKKKRKLSTSKNDVPVENEMRKQDKRENEVGSSESKKKNKKRKVSTISRENGEQENVEVISSSISKKNKIKKSKASANHTENGLVDSEKGQVNDSLTPRLKKKKIKKDKVSASSFVNSSVDSEKEQLNDEDSLEPSPKKKKVKKEKISTTNVVNSLVDSDIEQESGDEAVDDTKQVEKKVKRIPDPEELQRTIYVGNVPINSKKKQIKSVFKKYGPIETLRFRGIPVADPKIPKKVAAITKEFHPDRKSIFCYIRFIKPEDAQQAVQENGNIFKEHHLCVRYCGSSTKNDECKAIFIGNLNFRAEEEQLWKLFEPCGPIDSVRIVRDSRTGMGKGFGYVNFKDADAVQLALEMENVKLGDRELRIKLSSINTAKKNKKKENQSNATRRVDMQKKKKGDGDSSFQGTKFNNKNKKFKVNKGALEKKRKIKKIAPISK